jgi:exonuclease III
MAVTKIASININTVRAHTRDDMLFDFLQRHEIIGPNGRGTALVAKQHCQLSNVERTPSGRAIAATLNGTRIINVYAPSGTAKRAERESFYNQELATFLDNANSDLILGGILIA